ncbi:hypothetical protein [Pseudomonas sp. NPDC089406]|uniref:hypothetical protein n=1 Tax=Pseudomonas sp. NPDC089406 TaxID=3364463 RepID=UPI00384F046A
MTDEDRLLAAAHDHARDWRKGKSGGGWRGWHWVGLQGKWNVSEYNGESRIRQ